MGYHAEIAVLYKEPAYSQQKISVWRNREVISFGYITRLQKLTNKTCSFDPQPHQRAGVCVMALFLEKLFDQLVFPRHSHFAPSILIYEYSGYPEKIIGKAVDLGYQTKYSLNPLPIVERIRKNALARHNKVVTMDLKNFRKHLDPRCYHPIADGPLRWESCTVLAQWLREAEAERSEAWRELEKVPVSLALAKGWRAYLHEVGKVGARALFFFPEFPSY